MGDRNAAERPYRNDAFISYHHASDSAKAAHLRRGLQNFARSWRQLRALRVFLDKDSLSANPGLWPEIERQLADSGAFILLACPGSADSVWVRKEAEWWRTGLGPRKMLIAVTGGELVWDHDRGDFDWERTTCLPRTMAGMFTDEPRWVDLRWMSEDDPGSLRDPRFQQCVADLAAPLHGRPKEDLIGADVAQHRKTRRLARGALAVITTLAVLAGTASVVAVLQRDEARRQARLATSRQLAATALNLKDSNLRLASLLGIEAYRMQKSPETVTALHRLATDSPRLVGTVSAAEDITTLAYSQQDQRSVAVGDEGGAVAVWRGDGRSVRARTALPGGITAAAFGPDDRLLAVGDERGNLGVYDLTARKLRRLAPMPKGVASMDIGLAGDLVVADEDGTVSLYEGARKKVRTKRTGHQAGKVLFQDEEAYVLIRDVVGRGGLYTTPDLRTVDDDTDQIHVPAGQHTPAVSTGGHCFGYLKYGHFTASGLALDIGSTQFADTCAEFPSLPNEEAMGLALTDQGRMAVATDSGITLVDAQTDGQSSQVRTLTGLGPAGLMVFSGSGTRLASGHGRTAALWDVEQASRTAHRHGLALVDEATVTVTPPLALGPGGRLAWSNRLTGEPDDPRPSLHIRDPKGGVVKGGNDDFLYDALALSRDGRTLYAGRAGEVQEWRTEGSALVQRRTIALTGSGRWPQGTSWAVAPKGLATLADGSLAVAAEDGSVHLAARGAGRTRVMVPPAADDPADVPPPPTLSTDGLTAAVVNRTGGADVYDVRSGRRLQSVRLRGEAVFNVALAGAGRTLFLSGTSHTLARWDLDRRRFGWQSDDPHGARVAASDDGRTVVTLADSGALTLWDADTGDQLGGPELPIPPDTLSGTGSIGAHTSFVVADSGTVWTATEGGEVLSWDFSVDSWIKSLCHIAGRSLTDTEWHHYVGTTPPSRPTCG